jgi:choline-sulfatase
MKRRDFLKTGLVSSAAGLSGSLIVGCGKRQPPNILWLMTDEQRTDSLRFYDSPWAVSPNLDRYANEGVVFMNAYTPAPVCTPARVSILTGKYCSQTGVWRNIGNHELSFDLLTDVFRQAGYHSATFGKQHYGGPKKAFDLEKSLVTSVYVDPYGYAPQYDESKYDVVKYPGKWVLGGRFPEAAEKSREAECVDGAIAWLKEQPGDKPFLLRLSFSAPHTPVVPPVPFDTLIKEEEITLPPEGDALPQDCPIWMKWHYQGAGSWPFTPEQIRKMRRYYYGYAAFVDDQFGRLLRWMEGRGLLENTIIAFVADHGTHLCDNGLVQKGTFYDASARVPYFFWYPPKIAQGRTLQTPVETRTLLPTLLEMAGLPVPDRCAGISLAETLRKGKEPAALPVFSEMSFGFDPRHPDNRVVMVRDGQWKLCVCVDDETEKGELIDLGNDPLEQHNVYGQEKYAAIQQKLLQAVTAHIAGTEKPFANAARLQALEKSPAGQALCATCKRTTVARVDTATIAPDWSDAFQEAYQCHHCGARFGI